jgi:hypothetical protein
LNYILFKFKLLILDETDKQRLFDCVDASSKISSYVNKAVTECENRKRTEEIQSRMDTKEFDQYCVKWPTMAQYKVRLIFLIRFILRFVNPVL